MDLNFNADDWLRFAQDHWLLVVVALLAIVVIVKLVKTVLKWVVVAAIVIGIVAYGGYDIGNIGTKVTQELKDQAIAAMAGEASQATYADNEDGSYTIKTTNLELSGVPNSGEINVKLRGISLGTWKMEGAVRDFVVQARTAASQ